MFTKDSLLSFFPLVQNKFDYYQRLCPRDRHLFCWLNGRKIHEAEWVRDKDHCGSALQGNFYSVKAVPPDWPSSRLKVCAKAPIGG